LLNLFQQGDGRPASIGGVKLIIGRDDGRSGHGSFPMEEDEMKLSLGLLYTDTQ
jgi:hypothetical protein